MRLCGPPPGVLVRTPWPGWRTCSTPSPSPATRWGDVMFYGRGAGKLPTASAVVADVIDIAKDTKRDHHNQWGPGAPDLVVSSDILTSRWYVRAQTTMDQARLACGEIQPLARSGAPAGEAAFLTEPMTEPQVLARLAGDGSGAPGSACCELRGRPFAGGPRSA